MQREIVKKWVKIIAANDVIRTLAKENKKRVDAYYKNRRRR